MLIRKQRKVALSLAAMLVSSTSLIGLRAANAADVEAVGSWSGFYVGASLSGAGVQSSMDVDDFWDDQGYAELAETADVGALGSAFGGYVGYNFQMESVVLGVELNASKLGASGRSEFDVVDSSYMGEYFIDADYVASVRGRLGVVIGDTLPYLTGGLAWGRVETGIYAPDKYTRAVRDAVELGFVVGGGIETAISDNMIFRAEGTWTRLMTGGTQNDPDNDYGEITGFDDTDILQAGIGLSYMFNGGVRGGAAGAGSVRDWSGLYIGVSGGGAASQSGMNVDDFWNDQGYAELASNVDLGVLGGALGGYAGVNFQSGSAVYGLELNASKLFGSARQEFDVVDSSYMGEYFIEPDYVASLRGRVGMAMGDTLPYLTGGLAWGSVKTGIYAPDKYTRAVNNDVALGFIVGAGVETALSDNVLLRAESTWTRLMTGGTQNDPDNDYGEITGFDDTDLLQATVGIAYKFN